MEIHPLETSSVYFFLLSFIVALALSFWFYYKDRRQFNKPLKHYTYTLLIVLRTFVIATILTLVLSPFLEYIERGFAKPILVLAIDNSQSILVSDKSTQDRDKEKQIKTYVDAVKALKPLYEIHTYAFSDSIQERTPTFKSKFTTVEPLYNHLLYNYKNANLSAVVMLTDGIINQGLNNTKPLESISIPFYTVGVKNKSVLRDVSISSVKYLKEAELNATIPINYNLTVSGYKGKRVLVSLKNINGKVKTSKSFDINKHDMSIPTKFFITLDDMQHSDYTIEATVFKDEIIKTNNQFKCSITIRNEKIKVLLMASSPHPDIKAIKQTLEQYSKYEVDLAIGDKVEPSQKEYNTIVCFGSTNRFISKKNTQTPVFYILSNSFEYEEFNSIHQKYFEIIGPKVGEYEPNEVFGFLNKSFKLFNISEDLESMIDNSPPVYTPFGQYQYNAVGYHLITQKFRTINTSNPLLTFFVLDQKKVAFFLGQGLWKWRLNDYRKNNAHQNFNELITKTIDFLSLDNNDRLKLYYHPEIYKYQNFKITAESYNDNYQLSTENDVRLILNTKTGKKRFTFFKSENTHSLNINDLDTGRYDFSVETKFASKRYVKTGHFYVKNANIELEDIQSSTIWMKNLSSRTGGKYYDLRQMKQLISELKNNKPKRRIYLKKEIVQLINFKFVFYLLIGFLSIEWLIRRLNGNI